MKATWQRLANAIDALALRERLFVFLAALMLLAAGADALWLSPLWAEHKATRTALQRQASETSTLREQLRNRLGPGAGGVADESSRLRDEIRRGRAELATLARETAALGASADDPAQLPELLGRVLKRHERLTLVKLATVADEAPTKPSADRLRRHGVDLTLAGRYADLAHDLGALEQALPTLRWGALQLSARPGGDGATLTVRVFLVGADT